MNTEVVCPSAVLFYHVSNAKRLSSREIIINSVYRKSNAFSNSYDMPNVHQIGGFQSDKPGRKCWLTNGTEEIIQSSRLSQVGGDDAVKLVFSSLRTLLLASIHLQTCKQELGRMMHNFASIAGARDMLTSRHRV